MKFSKSSSMAIALFVALVATLRVDAQEPKPPRYSLHDLGTFLGGTNGLPLGINNRGWIDGVASLPGGQSSHAFLWRNGTTTDLGTLGGPNSFVGWPPNERGEITGNAETLIPDPLHEDFCGNGTGLICLGFVWQDGVMTPLPTLGGNNAIATQINNRGQAVGWAENTTHGDCISPQVLDIKAVIWDLRTRQVQTLPPYADDPLSAALGINDNGQVVGGSGICGPLSPSVAYHALLWDHGSVIDLGNLGSATGNFANAISENGKVAGVSGTVDGNQHAFIWQNGVMTDLGTLSGDPFSQSEGVNNKGQIVGFSCDSTGNYCHAFLWQNGAMWDLNDLVPHDASFSLLQADGINDRGEIVGQTMDLSTGELHGFLAVPVQSDSGDAFSGTPAGNSSIPRVSVPENDRVRLQRRRGFSGFRVGTN